MLPRLETPLAALGLLFLGSISSGFQAPPIVCGGPYAGVPLESPYSNTKCYPPGTIGPAAKGMAVAGLENRMDNFTCGTASCDEGESCDAKAEVQAAQITVSGGGTCEIPDTGGATGVQWTVTIEGGVANQSCTMCGEQGED